MTDMTDPDIHDDGGLRDVLENIETAVGEIRDAVLAPSSPLVFSLAPYAVVGAAWGWGVAEAIRGDVYVGILHGALWPLSAAFLIARWLAGGH
jgi:hypothetical protein